MGLCHTSVKKYSPRSTCISHFQSLEQTCRSRQLSGSGGKYFFPVSEVKQGHSNSRVDRELLFLSGALLYLEPTYFEAFRVYFRTREVIHFAARNEASDPRRDG